MNKQANKRKQSQDAIMDAARDEFIQQGFKGATVQAIADNANMPKANVLYYYQNKENLYHKVLEQTLEMWDTAIGDIVLEDGPKIALERFISAKVDITFENPKASKIYAMEIIQGAQHIDNFARVYLRNWVKEKSQIFEHWMNAGEMAKVDPVKLIFLIWSTTQHYADFETQILNITNKQEYEQEDREQVKAFLVNFILQGLNIK
ncbi:TetR/AcrR family transcriptional regulator [Thalassotalea eurytherma]|uniref:TetR family transcriptional regulator n=1 Tax=Thalassotalea eurytherma TaxID=1144278 RepID=A0ABQ6H1X7_9GAMM|nr:TetR/AcrR family transcriptional regulator [Thalassotalea eurytherma]GLX81899.1 TetR family transcriptional regulator [Thalassotalea eurytherma]